MLLAAASLEPAGTAGAGWNCWSRLELLEPAGTAGAGWNWSWLEQSRWRWRGVSVVLAAASSAISER